MTESRVPLTFGIGGKQVGWSTLPDAGGYATAEFFDGTEFYQEVSGISIYSTSEECDYPASFYEDRDWVPRTCQLAFGHGGNHFTMPQEPTPFAELLRAARASRKVETAEAEENLRPPGITVPGHEVDIASTSARTGVGQISRLARDNGWETKVGRSEAFSGDHLQKNGKVKPGSLVEHWWVEAVKTPHHFTYSLTDIRLDGRVVTKDELKEAISNGN